MRKLKAREKKLLRKLAERWSRQIGYKTACDHPTESSISFLHQRLLWLMAKKQSQEAKQDE